MTFRPKETPSRSSAPANSERGPQALRRRAEELGLSKELIVVALAGLVLMLSAWFVFFSETFNLDERAKGQRTERQLHALLQTAELQFSNDHLTQPIHDNALATYLAALKVSPDFTEAREGIQEIADRYLEITATLMTVQDLELARETLEAADAISAHLENEASADALSEARVALQSLERSVLEREAARVAGGPYPAFEVFQDQLKDGSKGPSLIAIPEGEFLMGSFDEEVGRDSDEGPQNRVEVQRFAIGATEVTFSEYDVFAKATGRVLPEDNGWGRGERPVINVTWRDAKDYTVWLSEQAAIRYRLPTEAEWEYAARAGTSTPYSTGTCLTSDQANFDDRNDSPQCPSAGGYTGNTSVVLSFPPNGWGLYGVHGNVREWLEDCLSGGYGATPSDGSAWYVGEGGGCGVSGHRVVRGGAWSSTAASSRTANRFGLREDARGADFGFRVARDFK